MYNISEELVLRVKVHLSGTQISSELQSTVRLHYRHMARTSQQEGLVFEVTSDLLPALTAAEAISMALFAIVTAHSDSSSLLSLFEGLLTHSFSYFLHAQQSKI